MQAFTSLVVVKEKGHLTLHSVTVINTIYLYVRQSNKE